MWHENDDQSGSFRSSCTEFACIDPAAECVDDDSVTVGMIDICNGGNIGNGDCDESNNNAECGTSHPACQFSIAFGHKLHGSVSMPYPC